MHRIPLTIVPAWVTGCPLLSPGGDCVLQLTPGLLDWLTVVLTVEAGPPAVRYPGGAADLDSADQGDLLHLVLAPGEVALSPSVAAPRTEHWHSASCGNPLTAPL